MRKTITISIRIPVGLAATLLREYPPEGLNGPSISQTIRAALETHAQELSLPHIGTKAAWNELVDKGICPGQARKALGLPETAPDPALLDGLWPDSGIEVSPEEQAAIDKAMEI